MALLQFKAPTLPAPSKEYDQNYMNQFVRSLGNYFNLLDSTTPIQVDTIILSGVKSSGYGLPIGSVYKNGDQLFIVVLEKAYAASFEVTTSLGNVTVTTS
jgi:hypothetical protein